MLTFLFVKIRTLIAKVWTQEALREWLIWWPWDVFNFSFKLFSSPKWIHEDSIWEVEFFKDLQISFFCWKNLRNFSGRWKLSWALHLWITVSFQPLPYYWNKSYYTVIFVDNRVILLNWCQPFILFYIIKFSTFLWMDGFVFCTFKLQN